MKIHEVRSLIRTRPVTLDPVRRRLAAAYSVDDLRRSARRLIPRPVFDYVDGAADAEISRADNEAAFQRWRFQPRLLMDVATVSTGTSLFGRDASLPLALAPTGYTRMMHVDGEIGAASAASAHGVPYTLSTMSTTSLEDLRAAHQEANLWFQLYVLRDAGLTAELVNRAEAAGYRVLVVTVDTVVPGSRTRDKRNGLVIPPQLTVSSLAQIASRPAYWTRMLRAPMISFANFDGHPSMTIEETIKSFNPSLTWDTIAALRERWPGVLVLKGPIGPADAARAVALGVDGIQLSNHGGRQLDRSVAPIDLVPGVREAIGPSVTLLVDSGIRHGADLAVALALGADAGVIGRAYLYGIMAGGTAGVTRVLDLMSAQFIRTLQFLGVTSLEELRKHGRELLAERS